jgi:DNA repair exonuclease SbcCD ATPase subunit
METSAGEFKQMPECYVHRIEPKSDTGIELELLQTFIFIPLDIFKKKYHNKGITNKLDAWLVFLSMDEPSDIINLITLYPEFKSMYETIYQMCQNVERVMSMFSEELAILDRNTVTYMIDEMQNELDEKVKIIDEKVKILDKQDETIKEKNKEIKEKDEEIKEREVMIKEREGIIKEKEGVIKEQDERIKDLEKQMEVLKQQLEKQQVAKEN